MEHRNFDNEIKDKDLLEPIEKISHGLDSLDQGFSVSVPNLEWFEELVLTEKAALRKRLLKELSLFMIVAALVLTAVTVVLFQLPGLFLMVQLLAIISVVVYSRIHPAKQVNGDEE